jgi:hypothetical protein
MNNLGGSFGRVLLRARVSALRCPSKQFEERVYKLVPENQQKADNAGDPRGNGHHLVGATIEREQIEMHAISVNQR